MKNFLHTPKRKGYFLAGLSAITISNVYICSKAALRETDIITFGFFWFLMAFSYNLIYCIATRKLKLYTTFSRNDQILLVFIGLFEMLAAISFFKGVNLLENPTIASFLDNCTPIFVTLGSIWILKEKFNRIEVFGMILAIVGAFLVSYSGSFSLRSLFINGSQYAVIASLLAAGGLLVARRKINLYDPAILSLNRTVYLVFIFFGLMLINHRPFTIHLHSFAYVSFGSFAGPFISAVLQYNALRYIEASRMIIIQSVRSFIVLIVSFLLFGVFPLAHQLTGGIIAVIGIIIIAFGAIKLQLINRQGNT